MHRVEVVPWSRAATKVPVPRRVGRRSRGNRGILDDFQPQIAFRPALHGVAPFGDGIAHSFLL